MNVNELNKYRTALPHLQRCVDELKQAQATLGWINDDDINNGLREALHQLELAISLMQTQMRGE